MTFLKVVILFWIYLGGSLCLADPLKPGGDLTHGDLSKNAFSHPGPNVKGADKEAFFVGNSFFKLGWVEAPASAQGRDGLGPTYNAVSCAACHMFDGRGAGYITKNGKERVHLSMLFRLSQANEDGSVLDHPVYGGQLNPLGISNVPGEAQAHVKFQKITGQFADGSNYELRRPVFTFDNFLDEPFGESTLVSPRVAPPVFGLGLIEAIPQADILFNEDPVDSNHDGISGRAQWVMVEDLLSLKLGRFGWKAGQPDLRHQNAAAFLGDIGITTTLFPKQNCPLVQVACAQSISGGVQGLPEAEDLVLDAVNTYIQALGVPERRGGDDMNVSNGEKLFMSIGCVSCHTPSWVTGTDHPLTALRQQTIYPYSDFLLHDMGSELADHRPEALASGFEWRTPPLWGIGLLQKVNKHQNLLHDGRARGVEEAILWHGGEAQAARENYKKLSSFQRSDLVLFINSL